MATPPSTTTLAAAWVAATAVGVVVGTGVGYASGLVLGGLVALVAIILGSGIATVTLAGRSSAAERSPGDLHIPLGRGLAVACFFTGMMAGAVLGVFLGPQTFDQPVTPAKR